MSINLNMPQNILDGFVVGYILMFHTIFLSCYSQGYLKLFYMKNNKGQFKTIIYSGQWDYGATYFKFLKEFTMYFVLVNLQ